MADPALLAGLVLATRIPFRSVYLYDVDSVNFALGMRRFDPVVHQPHPPGYFLYVEAARLANILFRDANAALVAMAVAASCATAILIFALAQAWFGRGAAMLAGLMFVFSPLAWFHGTVALIYAAEAFFSALVGCLCWLAFDGNPAAIVPAAVALGIATGFRPSSFLFLFPLVLLSAIKTARYALAGGVALALSLAAWFFPMMAQAGGVGRWWSSLRSLWLTVPAKETVLNSSPATSIARLLSIAGILLLCFGTSAVFAFRQCPGARAEGSVVRAGTIDARRRTFIFVWIAPGLLFFTFVFLKFVNSGYLLVVSPPLFALLGSKVPGANAKARSVLLAGVALVNSLIFLFAPVYCSWNSVRHFERELQSVLTALPKAASPRDTMIVGFDSHFLGYRHAGYYLPGWFTVEYPAVSLEAGTRIFAMEHGDTRLEQRLPTGRFRNFVFFPLPTDDAGYRDYFNRIRARFPAGALTSVHVDGREFVFGKASDLCFLFPEGGA